MSAFTDLFTPFKTGFSTCWTSSSASLSYSKAPSWVRSLPPPADDVGTSCEELASSDSGASSDSAGLLTTGRGIFP